MVIEKHYYTRVMGGMFGYANNKTKRSSSYGFNIKKILAVIKTVIITTC